MFSPAQNVPPPGSLRSSRRRQRPLSNEGSIAQPKAKRQRSALSEKTFLPPNVDNAPEMEETKHSRIATLPRRDSVQEVSGPQKEIVVRGRKSRSKDRGNKGDGSVILTTNDTYTVSKLPALPDRLRADVIGRQHGAIDSDSGYALTLTPNHAIAWPYAANIPSPETFTFALPNSSKHASDPLPLGSLVSPSASSSEPGLVVVNPSTGKIIYWESIASAATLDLKMQRHGVELDIPGMLSGETVVQILNAESAGFVLAFSTGRIAYLSVRDGHGRPAISVQFLRGTNAPGGGILGSLRHALSSSAWRGDIAALRAGQQETIGERNLVLATAKGKLQSWNLHRGGHASLEVEADAREAIVVSIKEALPMLSDLLLESFELLDFAYTPKATAASQLGSDIDDGPHILVLTSLTSRESSHYTLVEVFLKPSGLSIGTVRPIKSYTTPVSRMAISKTRLYLPKPALVAYVVFDRAVVIVSMARQTDSPDSQLRAESRILPTVFEDVIDFRQDMNVEIVGSGMEEPNNLPQGPNEHKLRRFKANSPATVLMVRGGGVVRIAATNLNKLISSQSQQLTARSKLEQAVFFGTLEQNFLNFSVRPELQFTAEEVAAAALELSLDILKSQTPYIPSVPASIDSNLRQRSKALRDLAEYLKASGVKLDRATKWKLLGDAEKMAAATLIWGTYNARLKWRPVGHKRGLLTELVEYIHEDYKTEPVPESGELDRVRHWFINDIWNLEVAVPWAYQVIKYTYQDGQKDHRAVMETISEANDVVLGALKGAFDFRAANLSLYNLDEEELEYGILKSGYADLPEFWTSSIYITENTRKQFELAGLLVKEYWNKPDEDGHPSSSLIDKVRKEQPDVIDVAIRSNKERVRWDDAQDSPQLQIEMGNIKKAQSEAEDEHLIILASDLELPEEAIDLAERHEILDTLASILLLQLNISATKLREPLNPDETQMWNHRATSSHDRVRHCFAKFGSQWASALYECQIRAGSLQDMFDDFPEEQNYLTAFLRSKPEYAKLAWIQETIREQNFDQAAKTLLELGLKREQDLWSKKIELSIGKLARLAGSSYSQKNGIIIPDERKTDLIPTDNELALIKIQDQIYEYMLPTIGAAIDEKAELQLALEAFGNSKLKHQPRFSSFLEEGMARVINHEATDALTLIDVLTLMGDGRSEEDWAFKGQRFYLALQASRSGVTDLHEQQLLQRVIWRRCMLRDEWPELNNTDLKDDEQVSEQLRNTTLYLTFRACLGNRLFDPDHGIKTISAREVLGAATEELDRRFKGLDASIRESIMKDMQFEDDAVRPYFETCRLDEWYQSALELARRDYEEEMAEETSDGLMMKQAEDQLEQVELDIAERERGKAASLLHSKPRYKTKARLNGSSMQVRASIESPHLERIKAGRRG